MAQAAATGLIHAAFAPNSASRSHRFGLEKLRPIHSFESKVFGRNEKQKSHRGASAGKIVRSELQVIPAEEQNRYVQEIPQTGGTSAAIWSKPSVGRKTKIVCTIGPSTNTREMIWKLAEAGMNVARLNMSHGDHASHQKVIDLVKEYNAQSKDNVIAIMLDTKGPEVRSGDLPQPIPLATGQELTFTIRRGVGTTDCVSVNYDDFVNDVEAGDMLLVDGTLLLTTLTVYKFGQKSDFAYTFEV